MRAITPSGAFGLYAVVCFFGWLFVIFCYPEVAGLGLESIREVFNSGFGVHHVNHLQRARKAAKGERRIASQLTEYR